MPEGGGGVDIEVGGSVVALVLFILIFVVGFLIWFDDRMDRLEEQNAIDHIEEQAR